ncbi:DUF6220 domain-containing protein [Paracoccus nototheniae]|uniref:DUF6220 domain-containing protein n=1 Tax=Paracoccus nototheniae TaxID=2489002 RepID=A0ABW4DWZ8_9RHOB|nr:DUF6220 domain-containing protein [Paracoccus nototheniae]
MMKWHDTLCDLKHGTPVWFTLAAWMLPAGIGAQFLIAGGAMFQDPRFWDLHGMLGGLLAIPVLIGMVGAIVIRRLRGFGWWAGVILALYGVQLALAAEAKPVPLAFHPFNAALLLSASLVQLAKVERRRDL